MNAPQVFDDIDISTEYIVAPGAGDYPDFVHFVVAVVEASLQSKFIVRKCPGRKRRDRLSYFWIVKATVDERGRASVVPFADAADGDDSLGNRVRLIEGDLADRFR